MGIISRGRNRVMMFEDRELGEVAESEEGKMG